MVGPFCVLHGNLQVRVPLSWDSIPSIDTVMGVEDLGQYCCCIFLIQHVGVTDHHRPVSVPPSCSCSASSLLTEAILVSKPQERQRGRSRSLIGKMGGRRPGGEYDTCPNG